MLSERPILRPFARIFVFRRSKMVGAVGSIQLTLAFRAEQTQGGNVKS